jgi:DNA-directed RNA polymerase subunit RPC12/RpoP
MSHSSRTPDIQSVLPGTAITRSPLTLVISGSGMVLCLALMFAVAGCGVGSDNAALDPDANGFICLDCSTKFHTDRKVFANHCPSCSKARIEMVVGFVCPADNTVTYLARGPGAIACPTCRKVTNHLVIPTKEELIAWGAEYKTANEVGVH